jgi:mono/diheme cytochrome c family protein
LILRKESRRGFAKMPRTTAMEARMRFWKLLSMPASLLLTLPALAQSPDAGHELARRWCADCHKVERTVQGPLKDTVPTFMSIARMRSTTALSLTAFLMTPHPSMPNFSLSRQEIRDVVSYILGLKDEEKGPGHRTGMRR